ncbi:hypothetical protein SMGD1_0324 [Sulfurimonas gotlandica GD1]|uniref:Uncharacterized protein n=1 Tax=Sulfurimonas gotlandica (strain DSM 19862 / JCM 16533 / GD1) TaxID=929558 RepID=B6BNP8_SULGG|nr:hypothetical protein [Sulfurimonas gotlandica]EDZ61234.1 conserved hypothetical protein [Sulfurimonas gotlandica GD1]EHP28851.1 hypothetical protein SMGD1_0324 [Sulfurimonas gotlandica GD1]
MPETEEERKKRVLRELEGKNIAHYSVLLSAWIQTKMERDKTLVTLSSAAIGLLITILTTVGAENYWIILLFIISICSFIITIWSALKIYELNSVHLEDSLRGKNGKDPKLEKYDKRSIRAFVIGSSFALLIGVTSAYQKIILKEEKMGTQEQNGSKKVMFNDSFNGIAGLNPQNIEAKSINGISNLNPETTQQPKVEISQPQEQNSTNNDSNNSNG